MASSSSSSSISTRLLSSPAAIFFSAVVLRAALLLWGRYQDAHSPLKYTDIDYLVFTDAARAVAGRGSGGGGGGGGSPYARDTYRYTPLLAWALLPTARGGWWFEFGKAVFAAGDVATGWLVYAVLRRRGMGAGAAARWAGIWLVNPMVANISTRGSSEGLLAVIVVALVWAAEVRAVRLAGALLGLGVHFKIYPFVYAVAVYWALGGGKKESFGNLFNRERVQLGLYSFVTFMGLNVVMFRLYGWDFIKHSYAYHLTRIDHRHNFSVYNTLLHLKSADLGPSSGLGVESLAFIPQLFLSVFAIPLLGAKKDLATTMLAQTFAFVTFNKVCTSQYFLWYMVFLPFYLPTSSLIRRPKLGYTALGLWVIGQALWLQQGYQLEFLGKSTFVLGLWLASAGFFGINCWILGIVVSDMGMNAPLSSAIAEKKAQ